MEFVTVVNRVNRILQGTWDGKHYDLPPGKSSHPILMARVFKRQNPVMGSEDPRTGHMDYLIGIEEFNDPCDPIQEIPNAVERWDRSKLAGARPSEVVPGDNGLYQLGRSLGSGPLPFDTAFVPAER